MIRWLRYLFTSECHLPDAAMCDCHRHSALLKAEVEQFLRAQA